MNKISSFTWIVIFTSLSLIGLSLIPLLNIQLNPSDKSSVFTVSYHWEGASAKVIEQDVTIKLERIFGRAKGIKEISSMSKKGAGRIVLTFKEHVSTDAIRFELSMLISRIYTQLPEQVSYPALVSGYRSERTEPLLVYSIHADASPYFIQSYVENNLLPKISAFEGVDQALVYGASAFEWVVTYQQETMQIFDLTPIHIQEAISSYLEKRELGKASFIEQGSSVGQEVRVVMALDQAETLEWGRIPIATLNNKIIRLQDVATVRYEEGEPTSYFRINGLNMITTAIYPENGSNTIVLSKKLRAMVNEYKKDLPVGYSMQLMKDSSEFLVKELNKIAFRTTLSLIILLLFIFITYRSWKYLFLIGGAFIVNLLVSCSLYYFLSIEIHLYSLAAITISMGMIIDTIILMMDHIVKTGNRKIISAILGSTLTTIGAVSVIFFLEDEQRQNLFEFTQVIIVNIGVSMVVATILIPALMEKVNMVTVSKSKLNSKKRRIIYFTRVYASIISFGRHYKWLVILVFVISFGLPVQLLPEKVEGNSDWANFYNEMVHNRTYKGGLRAFLGGSMLLFSEDVFDKSHYSEPTNTVLHVKGRMPEGCTVHQLNEALMKMEDYLGQFDEISEYETAAYNYRDSDISIRFKEGFSDGNFPYELKSKLESQALLLGGVDWSVFGVGLGFSNGGSSGMRNSRIILEGYNYDKLYEYASSLEVRMKQNPRIVDTGIVGGSASSSSPALEEYHLSFDREKMALNQITDAEIYDFLKQNSYSQSVGYLTTGDELQTVTLKSDGYQSMDKWDLEHLPFMSHLRLGKIGLLGELKKRSSGNEIHKKNQQYQLTVSYDFLGVPTLIEKAQEKYTQEMNDLLPLGYQAKDQTAEQWNRKDEDQYYLILLVLLIIYFVCAIILESFMQPLIIVTMIPISFIGLFLTFYFFDVNFDQGGYAAFIMLSGLTVNAGLYILNDFNVLRKERPGLPVEKSYLKAFNSKIAPIILTILSTILGLLPFVVLGQVEVFWFSFGAGTIGGLVFSIVAILFCLPVFLRFRVTSRSK